jgi:hypothetical protein
MDVKAIQLPEQEHEYDNQTILPKEFLLAVMNDKTLPLRTRMDAAVMAAPYYTAPMPTCRVNNEYMIKVPGLYE